MSKDKSEFNIDTLNLYFKNIEEKNKAKDTYNTFLQALKTKSNQYIENTLVIKALEILSRPTTKAFKIKLNKGYDKLYRSRKISIENLRNGQNGISCICDQNYLDNVKFTGYNEYNSKEAPLTVPANGRNNISGASYLYLAKDEYTACAEIRPDDKSLVSVAKFKVKRPLSTLDLSDDDTVPEFEELRKEYGISPGELLTQIMYQFSYPISNSEDYYASQYIADYIRKSGYDGLAYRSSCTNGINYTLFHSGKEYIEFVYSKIVNVVNHSYNIVDLNSKKRIRRNTEFLRITDKGINEAVREVSKLIPKHVKNN